MDNAAPGAQLADQPHARRLVITVLSVLTAMTGLTLAILAAGHDNTMWLISGTMLGVLGPLLISLLARLS
jgi:hypothetical protein